MRFEFSEQGHQKDCLESLLSVLKASGFFGLRSGSLKGSVEALQKEKRIPLRATSDEPHLDVLMETGTGKTFTYLELMHRLYKEYRQSKFVVFVPRRAILEGVKQNIKLTDGYFLGKYDKRLRVYVYNGDLQEVMRYCDDSSEPSVLMLTSASINREGGPKSKPNRLRRRHEMLGSSVGSVLEKVAKLEPVVVIDEPHLLKADQFMKAYNDFFQKSLRIRFGATFPKEERHAPRNVVYVLDSMAAFRLRLTKKIWVTDIRHGGSTWFSRIPGKSRSVMAHVFKNNEWAQKEVKFGDDVGSVTGDENYRGKRITSKSEERVRFSDRDEQLLSKEGYNLSDDAISWMIRDAIERHFEKEKNLFEKGIKALTLFFIPGVKDFRGGQPRIKNIFEKQYRKVKLNLKKELENASAAYREFLSRDDDDEGNLKVHGGYFSGDGGGSGEAGEGKDVDLILKKKTSLLSLDEPLRFIFSVWALQEGWDNPNIFTLCKLAPSSKETSRRQQVGRGLRLAVDQRGVRQTMKQCQGDVESFYDTNQLDVVVYGQDRDFIQGLQGEIRENSFELTGNKISIEALKEMGLSDLEASKLFIAMDKAGVIRANEKTDTSDIVESLDLFLQEKREELSFLSEENYERLLERFQENQVQAVDSSERKKKAAEVVRIRPKQFEKFQELWKQITRRASFSYGELSEEKIVEEVVRDFSKETIGAQKAVASRRELKTETLEIGAASEKTLDEGRKPMSPDDFFDFVKEFARDNKWPLPFVRKLFDALVKAGQKRKIENDPKRAKELIQQSLKESVYRHAEMGVRYQFSELTVGSTAREILEGKDKVERSKLGIHIDRKAIPPDHYLYEQVVFDSNFEKDIVLEEGRSFDEREVTVFAKLPRIEIPTPFETYSPDFAYCVEVKEKDGSRSKRLFLVVEAKGYDREKDIPRDEERKFPYAEKFFARLDRELGDLAMVKYKLRLNRKDLGRLLDECFNGDNPKQTKRRKDD